MTMKESSDEVNPDIATPNAASPTPKRKTVGDYVALAIATCGVGYFPIAPGTMGSLAGVGIYLLLRRETIKVYVFDLGDTFFSNEFASDGASFLLIPVLLLVVTVLSLIGIWAASRAERLFGKKDPGAVVIDEVVGQLMTFAFMPHFIGSAGILMGFVLFRLFDIVKPYPIRKLEKLPSGLGIVVDDLAAGFYAGMTLLIISTLFKLQVWHA
jgi:phosphatidylglycerophosphatase A